MRKGGKRKAKKEGRRKDWKSGKEGDGETEGGMKRRTR